MYYNRLNKKETGVYSIEEEKIIKGGQYTGRFNHGNVIESSIMIYTEPNMKGELIDSYFIEQHPEKKWVTNLVINHTKDKVVYVNYETAGDIVDADDINFLQNKLKDFGFSLDVHNNKIIILEDKIDKKPDKTYIDSELDKKYNKDETYNKKEVDDRIAELIGAAPEALDTLQELAEALDNDPNFAATMTKEISKKVDKEDGKGLSTNDFTNILKNKLINIEDEAEKNNPIIDNLNSDSVTASLSANQGKVLNEIKANKSDVPTKLSELTNDTKFITLAEVPKTDLTQINNDINTLKTAKADKTFVTEELNKKANKTEIPTKVGQLENDAKFITLEQVPETDLSMVEDSITQLQKSKADKTAIPTKLSELSNDTKFITIQDVPETDLSGVTESIELNNQEISELKTGKANKADIPTKLGQLTNDVGYLTGQSEEISSLENDVASLKSTKADTTLVTGEIARLEKAISELDIPEEVDLTPINKSIEELNANKIDRAEFEKRLDEEIMALIDGAPEALDTLGELAKALGEDANFSVTVTNMIAEKVSNEKFNTEIERLEKRINNLDIPEGVDLTPVYAEIDKLKASKLDVSKFNEEMAKVATIEYVVAQLENKANVEDIPTKISELINDAKYITLEEVPKVDLTDINSNIDMLKESKASKTELSGHTSNVTNPHKVTKAQIGLGNVNNTADMDKPISTLTQLELDKKANKSEIPNKLSELEDNKKINASMYSDRLKIADTRDVDNTPLDIMKSGASSLMFEFKKRSVVGNPDLDISAHGSYAHILTVYGWTDNTGGYPTQISFGKEKVGIRTGISNTEWSEWRKYSDDSFIKSWIPTKLSQLSNDVGYLKKGVTWGDLAGK